MPPQQVSSPDRRFVVTRIDAGVETNVIASTPLSVNYSTDKVLRVQMYDNVRAYLAANPGVHLRIYGPTSGGAHTDNDCIWDSLVSAPLPVIGEQ